jgi:hypothetical protein
MRNGFSVHPGDERVLPLPLDRRLIKSSKHSNAGKVHIFRGTLLVRSIILKPILCTARSILESFKQCIFLITIVDQAELIRCYSCFQLMAVIHLDRKVGSDFQNPINNIWRSSSSVIIYLKTIHKPLSDG